MYILLSETNTVLEIIPDENPIFPGIPIEERYAPDFVDKLRHFPDETEVGQNWHYDPDENKFWPEGDPAAPVYTTADLLRALTGTNGSNGEPAYTEKEAMTTLLGGTLVRESGGGNS